jgi:hypothetical protein
MFVRDADLRTQQAARSKELLFAAFKKAAKVVGLRRMVVKRPGPVKRLREGEDVEEGGDDMDDEGDISFLDRDERDAGRQQDERAGGRGSVGQQGVKEQSE